LFKYGIRAGSGNLYIVYQALEDDGKAQEYLKQFQEIKER